MPFRLPFLLSSFLVILLGVPMVVLGDLNTGLVGYWNMDSVDIDWSTNSIHDRSGTGNVGTFVGLSTTSSSVSGKYAEAMHFETSGTYINVPNAASLNMNTVNAFTLSAWIKLAKNPGQYLSFIDKNNAPSFWLGSNGGILFRPGGTVSQFITNYTGNKPDTLGVWHHFVATYDGVTEKVYVDGSLKGSQTSPGTAGSNTAFLRLGGSGALSFDMDEVRVYNRVLSPAEVFDLHNATTFDATTFPPATPSGFASTAHSENTVFLSWSANTESNLTAYHLYINNGLSAVVSKNATTYVAKNLSPAMVYLFSLSAINDRGEESAKSPELTVVTSAVPSLGIVSPAAYLAVQPHPVFKSGNNLPPLSKWGWTLNYDILVEMARWGYALDFGDADAVNTVQLDNPNSAVAKLVALARNNPSVYPLSVNIARVPVKQIPSSAYTVDASGHSTLVWSPEAPDALMTALAATTTLYLQKVLDRAPVAIILNGGERFMGVQGQDRAAWAADPSVFAAKGSLSWSDYQSMRKAHQEMFFTNAVHAVTSAPYIWYFTGNQFRADGSFWDSWDWDYKWMKTVADYPNASMYYKDFNSGWTGTRDMLTQVLNTFGHVNSIGRYPLSYNWVNAGYATDQNSSRHGDLNLYKGFLKSYYTAGMVGGIAGYFAYPNGGFNASFDSKSPPHWLEQIRVLSHVHAEFSYLEDMLRNGELLPGTGNNTMTASQPAYEFPTGHLNTRVLVRKMLGRKRWLVTAWAADGVERQVSVTVPILGTIDLLARPEGSIYDARIVGGTRTITFLDSAYQYATPLTVPNSVPDNDGTSSIDTIPPTISITTPPNGTTVSGRVTFAANAGDNIAVAAVQFKVDNINHSIIEDTTPPYSMVWNTMSFSNGAHTLTAIARDVAGNFAISVSIVTVKNVSVAGITPSPIPPIASTTPPVTASSTTPVTTPPAASSSGGSAPASTPAASSRGGGGGGGSYVPFVSSAAPTVTPTPASTLSATQRQSLIAELLAQVLELQKKIIALGGKPIAIPVGLSGGASTQLVAVGSSSFTRNLKRGDRGEDVRALQRFLNTHGFAVTVSGDGSSGKETTYFGPATVSALIRFQNAYKSDILAPAGLSAGTGFFGAFTRGKVAELGGR